MPIARESKLTLGFILITILLDMVGLGIILPVLPNLILELTGDTVARSAVIGDSGVGSVLRAPNVLGGRRGLTDGPFVSAWQSDAPGVVRRRTWLSPLP